MNITPVTYKTIQVIEYTARDLEQIKPLTHEVDTIQKNLNENSENSQKQNKFLDDAFKDIARLFFTQNAHQQHRNNIDFNNDTQNPNLNENAANLLYQDIADAENKSVVFADSFLKNYKKQGIKAYNTAMSLL